MSRGPGKLQRDILAAVAEHGPIGTTELADLIVGPLEHEPWTTPLGAVTRIPTRASQTHRRSFRRAVQGLLQTGRLVEHRRADKIVVKMEAAQVLKDGSDRLLVLGTPTAATWERIVALPEQIDQRQG